MVAKQQLDEQAVHQWQVPEWNTSRNIQTASYKGSSPANAARPIAHIQWFLIHSLVHHHNWTFGEWDVQYSTCVCSMGWINLSLFFIGTQRTNVLKCAALVQSMT